MVSPIFSLSHLLLVDTPGESGAEERLHLLRSTLAIIPQVNLKMLQMICKYFHDVSVPSKLNLTMLQLLEYEEITKMGATNFAIVVSPNVLRPEVQSPLAMISKLYPSLY